MLIAEPAITEGTLQTTDGRVLPLERTRVQAHILGPLATVEVLQTFRNPTQDALEATYLFPLPHQASVFRMELRIADRVVRGLVKEKEEARRTYEAARAEGRAATLLEQDKPNLFTLSVANIAPGATIDMLLEYQDLVGFDDGDWRFAFPMVASERYNSPSSAENPSEVKPPRPRRQDRVSPLTLDLFLRGVTEPESPTHPLRVQEVDGGYRVELGDTVPNRDFVLTWRTPGEGLQPKIWFEKEADKPGTFCVCLPAPSAVAATPAARPAEENLGCANCGGPLEQPDSVQEIPGLGPAWRCEYCGVFQRVEPYSGVTKISGKDVVFLVDRSASMKTLGAAASVVMKALSLLSPSDTFAIIGFHHEVTRLAQSWLPCNGPSLKKAEEFLAGLSSRGGTELELALQAGGADPRSHRTRVMVLLTDGAVGNEGRLLRQLPKWLDDARLYVLGLGPACNRYLISKLAQYGNGSYDIAVGHEPAVLERFARRVAQAAPLLNGLSVSLPGTTSMDVYPKGDLSLFTGQSVMLVGRYVGSGPARLLLTGFGPSGAPFRQELELTLPEAATEAPGLERVWARLRIEDLQDQVTRRPERLSEIRLEVLGLALKHQLMSSYTALVAEDSEVSVDPKAASRTVEVEPPAPAIHETPPSGSFADEEGDSGPFDLSIPTRGMARSVVPFAAPAPASPPRSPSPAPAAAPAMDGMFACEPEPEACDDLFGSASPEMFSDFGALDFDAESPGGVVYDLADAPFADDLFGDLPFAEPAPQQGQVPAPKRVEYSAEELARAREMVRGHLELVFLIDETGSMGPYIGQVQAHLLALIGALRESPLCRTLRLGLVTYRDHPPQEASFVTRVVPLTEDIDAVAVGVRSMRAQGGGDGPEAVTDGLNELLALDWEEDAARLAVMVGDAPPHGVVPSGDGFPDGCPCGRHWHTQAESCREMGITVHTVGCAGLTNFPGAEQVFQLVARTTGGLYVPLAQASLLIALISGLADRELDRQRLRGYVRKVWQAHRAELEAAESAEQVRFVTESLQASGLRVLDLANRSGSGALAFRPVQFEDVELALENVRSQQPALT